MRLSNIECLESHIRLIVYRQINFNKLSNSIMTLHRVELLMLSCRKPTFLLNQAP